MLKKLVETQLVCEVRHRLAQAALGLAFMLDPGCTVTTVMQRVGRAMLAERLKQQGAVIQAELHNN